MPEIVWVEALVDEVAPAEWPVVCVHAGLTAWLAVPVLDVGAHAARIASKDAPTEPLLVLLAVSALPCAAAPLFGLASVFGASAGLGVLRAARGGADPPTGPFGHGNHLPRLTV